MPAIPVKERWWKTRADPDSRGEWWEICSERPPLKAAWSAFDTYGEHSEQSTLHEYGLAAEDPQILAQLKACTVCGTWDHESVTQPIDVPLIPTNKRKCIIDPSFYKHLYIFKPYSSPLLIIHRRLIDELSQHVDDNLLFGEVYPLGGDRIPELVSVIDRCDVPIRAKYTKAVFRHPLLKQWVPCHHCGRFPKYIHDGHQYLYTPELPNRAVRCTRHSVLVPPEAVDHSGLRSQAMWPRLKRKKVSEFNELLDPAPTPYPKHWNEIEVFFRDRGHPIRIPTVLLRKNEEPGSWIQSAGTKLGKRRYLTHEEYIRETQPPIPPVFIHYLRLRSLFEPSVAKRIDHWDDDTLVNFMSEYREATSQLSTTYSLQAYFPV